MYCLSIFIIAAYSFSFYGIEAQQNDLPSEEVTAPNDSLIDFSCGTPNQKPVFFGSIKGKTHPIYYLNITAQKLTSEGFEIKVGHMIDDAIYNFTYTNGTFTGSLGFDALQAVAAVGGKPASRVRAFYMAQLGKRTIEGITWLCDGVLISTVWVLSAAHCFLNPITEPNIIRLGDYDLTEQPRTTLDVIDFPITNIIFHPKFKFEERYHDLVLIKLPGKYPQYTNFINPICLPWNSESNLSLVGSEVVLTGWGATVYGGEKTTLLQEVDLRVFHPSVCNASYSQLPSFRKKYPNGMADANILCAGWEEGGKDACGGDSGAPVAYQREVDNKIVLAGIVSGGYGCGLKDYPGLYIPINKPEYLQWIKETAFQGQQITFPKEEVAAPNISRAEFSCGYLHFLPKYWGTIGEKKFPMYYLNATAEQLSSEGFDITVDDMVDDAISNFTYTNRTFSGNIAFDSLAAISSASPPGQLNPRIRGFYMALIGVRTGDDFHWVCDGVLINKEWVLSAAHCFVDLNIVPNVIRLGEYDLLAPAETDQRVFGKFVNDYPIDNVIFHPKFNLKQRYHDLALIQLPRKYPKFTNGISPICLPWDAETNRDLVGTQGVLTGWWPAMEGGEKSTVLQEAKMTVLTPSVCNSQLDKFSQWYPRGLSSSNTLCAGLEDGLYAICAGDAGSPLTYQINGGSVILAGIASSAECELNKEDPGLYVPINRPEYLQWIKETAFKEYL